MRGGGGEGSSEQTNCPFQDGREGWDNRRSVERITGMSVGNVSGRQP